MSVTLLQLEESPDQTKTKTFGSGIRIGEDHEKNPLELLKSYQIIGSWDLNKMKEILNKINEIALLNSSRNRDYDKHYKTRKVSININSICNKDMDFSSLYGAIDQQQEYDNKNQRIKQMVQNYQNRVIMRSARPSSVRQVQIEQPQKSKFVSKEFEKNLQTIDLKYGTKQCQIQAKSRYMDHLNTDSYTKNPTPDKSRPQTTKTNIRGYSFQREKMFDLDQKFMKTSLITRRRAFSATQNTHLKMDKQKTRLKKLLEKCDDELRPKIDSSKVDKENTVDQIVYMLDDSDSQMKRLARCIKFNPISSIKNEFQDKMPGDQDFILKQKLKIMLERKKRLNGQKQQFSLVKADSNLEAS